jgi:GT2 family glycosyltransferase
MPQTDHVDLTLSIVNTNNRDLLRGCLKTIAANAPNASYEIIVVDNASTDRSVEMVREEFPHVRLIQNMSRQGYGRSHNQAIAASRGDYVLVLNEDMEMLNGAIEKMLTKARETERLGVLGCKILNPDRSLQHSCFNFPTLLQELFEAIFPYTVLFPNASIRSKMYWWRHDVQMDVDIVLGCCMLLPKEAIKRVGAFDPSFFVYSEEHDLCKRMRASGLRVVFTPEAEMIHFGGQSTKHMSLKMALVQIDSRIRYFDKHHGRTAATLFRGILAISALVRLIGWAGIYLLPKGHRKDARSKLREYAFSTRLIFAWKR